MRLLRSITSAIDVSIMAGISIYIAPGQINGHLVRSDTNVIAFICSSRHNLLIIFQLVSRFILRFVKLINVRPRYPVCKTERNPGVCIYFFKSVSGFKFNVAS